ncbi:RNA-binding domain-containing protein [Lysobacter sp. CA196]|uniref:RNA-binding domain-containing protein n=1 Tax=Lysobacter sp. CA196 TaxID=3455606 RepID=UPI003F8CF98B
MGGQQADLFNSTDLVATGDMGDGSLVRAYQISVSELRQRLEALGYSLDRVRADINATIRRGYAYLQVDDPPERKAFLDYGSTVTVKQLIALVREWKNDDSHFWEFSSSNAPAVLLEFMRGGIRTEMWPNVHDGVDGYHFERLICEVHDDSDIFEIDFTDLVHRGHVKPDQRPLQDNYDHLLSQVSPRALRLGQRLSEEESDVLEFKGIESANPCRAIGDGLSKYIIGYLNHKGGRILYGVTDDGIVQGVALSRSHRDELSRRVNAVCANVTPRFSMDAINLEFRPIINLGKELPDTFVIELAVSPGKPNEMYFRQGDTWVRSGTETRSLKGHELFVHIAHRYSATDDSLRAFTESVLIATGEIARLKQEGERYEGELSNKHAEMEDMRSALSGVWKLLKETDMMCPKCEAAVKERHPFSEVHVVENGSLCEIDFEVIDYYCGYKVRTDQRDPVSPCLSNP